MKIYISGQITGLPQAKARANFAAAADQIRRKGHEPVNPCLTQELLDPKTTSWVQYMEVCLALLRVCDAIVFLPGAARSKGSNMEAFEARNHNKKVFTSIDTVPEEGVKHGCE